MGDLAYQLKADLKHDHDMRVFRRAYVPKPLWKEGARDDALSEAEVYRNLVESKREDRRWMLRLTFLAETETAAYRHDGTAVLFPGGGTDNSTIGILHDAGPRLSELTRAKNYITWGSVLDSAGKPRIPRRDVYANPVENLAIDVQELGFNPEAVSKLVIHKYRAEDASASILVDGTLLDLADDTKVPWDGVTPLATKHMNILSGFLTSNARIRDLVETAGLRAYLVGKALGDALQVRSLKEPLPAGLTRAVLSTEDQLNHVRAFLLDVDSCWVRRRVGVQPRVVEYLPSSSALDSDESAYEYYKTSIAQLAKHVHSRYLRATTDVHLQLRAKEFKPTYVSECLRLMRLLEIAVLFPIVVWAEYAKSHDKSQLARVQNAFFKLNVWSRKWTPNGSVLGPTGELNASYVICQTARGVCDLGGFPIVMDGEIPANEIVGALYGENALPPGVVIPINKIAPYVDGTLWYGPDPGGIAISGVQKGDKVPYGLSGDYVFRFGRDAKEKETPTIDWVVGPLPPRDEPPADGRKVGEKSRRDEPEPPAGAPPLKKGGGSGDMLGYEGILGEWLRHVEDQGLTESEGVFPALTILAHSETRDPVLYKVIEEEVLGYLPQADWEAYKTRTPPPSSELLWDAFVAHINACNFAYPELEDTTSWSSLWGNEAAPEVSKISGEYLEQEAELLKKYAELTYTPSTPTSSAPPSEIVTQGRSSSVERSPEGTIVEEGSTPPSPIALSFGNSESSPPRSPISSDTEGRGRIGYLVSHKSRGIKTRRTYKHGTRRK